MARPAQQILNEIMGQFVTQIAQFQAMVEAAQEEVTKKDSQIKDLEYKLSGPKLVGLGQKIDPKFECLTPQPPDPPSEPV